MPSVPSSRGRHASPLWAAVGALVGTAVILAGFTASGLGIVSHTVCKTGQLEADQNFWTPFDLTNAPYGGHTTWGASFYDWELGGYTRTVLSEGNLSNGNISTGYFETENWSVQDQSNSTVVGPGVNTPCTTNYRVVTAPSTRTIVADGPPLQGPGNGSNANEPTTYAPDGYPAATFSNGFVSANEAPISTCGGPGRVLNMSSESFRISFAFHTSKGPLVLMFPVSSLENYTYYFPANFGMWQVDNLSAAGGPGSGWAFSYSPCS
jgi:hypothetical protein